MLRMLVYWWIASLIVVAGLASALTFAQARQEPRILSGGDIGFRVEGTDRAGDPIGTLMLRIDGAWRPAGSAPSWRPAK